MKNRSRIEIINENKLVIKGEKDHIRVGISLVILIGYIVLLIIIKPDEFSYLNMFMFMFVLLFILYTIYVNVFKRLIINSEHVVEKSDDTVVVNTKNMYNDIRSVYVSYVPTVYYVVGFKYYNNRIRLVPLAATSKDEAFAIANVVANFLNVELIDETENNFN